MLAILALFEIPAIATGAYTITSPETMDERDGPLLMTLMDLAEWRFPLVDASRHPR
jgi:hypothetical protein